MYAIKWRSERGTALYFRGDPGGNYWVRKAEDARQFATIGALLNHVTRENNDGAFQASRQYHIVVLVERKVEKIEIEEQVLA